MTNYNERLDEILLGYGAEEGEFTESLKQALLDWHNKQVIQELREAKRSSDAGWYATYRIAELEKESNRLNPSKSTHFNKLKEVK